MKQTGFVVYIVEDDPSVRDALSLFLSMKGYVVAVYADAESFLDALQTDWIGCVLVDIRMPRMSGLELQRELINRQHALPVIIMTGHGDINAAREAFRSNAVDFLEKPLDHDKLIMALQEAFTRQEALSASAHQQQGTARAEALLTPREKEILGLVAQRKHNQEIAATLGISIRTVEAHRSRIIGKLRANGMNELERLGMLSERKNHPL